MDEESIALMVSAYMTDNPGSRMLGWGHSHPNFSVFYSSTDESTWNELTHRDPEFFVGTCHNIEGEVYSRVRLGEYDIEGEDILTVYDDVKIDAEVKEALGNMTKPKVSGLGRYKAYTKSRGQAYQTAWSGFGDTWDDGWDNYKKEGKK